MFVVLLGLLCMTKDVLSWKPLIPRSASSASSTSSTSLHRTTTTSAPVCTICTVDQPQDITFSWPPITFTHLIVATIITQINTKIGYTTSTTKYVETSALVSGSGGGVVQDVTAYWESKLSLKKVIIIDGTPTAFISPAVPTSPSQYLTVTTGIVSPTPYENFGYVATAIGPLTTVSVGPDAICTTQAFGLHAQDYSKPVLYWDFFSMVKNDSRLSDCSQRREAAADTEQPVTMTSALTATTTDFGNFVAPQQSTPSIQAQASSTSPQAQNVPLSTTPLSTTPVTTTPATTTPVIMTPKTTSIHTTSVPITTPIATTPITTTPIATTSHTTTPVPATPVVTTPATTSATTMLAPSTPVYTTPVPTSAKSMAPNLSTTTSNQSIFSSTLQAQNNVPSSSANTSPTSSSAQPLVVVGGTTVSAGASAITVGGVPVSFGSSGSVLVIGSSTMVPKINSASAQPVVIAGTTITPGAAPVTIDGTRYSLASGGTALVSGSSTLIAFGTSSSPMTAPPVVISGHTITPGAPAITISGTPISLGSQGSVLVVGSSTMVPNAVNARPTSSSSHAVYPVVILGMTISPGSPAITIGDTRMSLDPHGSALIIGSSTMIIPDAIPSAAQKPQAVVISGVTLTPGASSVTIDGTAYSLAPEATALIEGSSTLIPFATAAIATTSSSSSSSTGGLGSIIWVGLGGTVDSTSTSTSTSTSSTATVTATVTTSSRSSPTKTSMKSIPTDSNIVAVYSAFAPRTRLQVSVWKGRFQIDSPFWVLFLSGWVSLGLAVWL